MVASQSCLFRSGIRTTSSLASRCRVLHSRRLQPLHLIDAIGPFFRGHDVRTINWSKIPWHHLPQAAGPEADAWWALVRADLTRFADQAAAWGFNAVSLDDVTHLADHAWLEPELRARIAYYRAEFARCFEIFKARGLQIHLTMDVMTYTPELRRRMVEDKREVNDYLAELLDGFFVSFPQVAGIILRIGESDGKGVHDEFRSELVIQKPAQARKLLLDLLPVCEKHSRRLIFRTWTVGAYRIGDLMWHRRTFTSVFEGLTSPALVISMKYGESDFFRYLPLNSNFFRTDVAKIVELQTRREYEGCGEYPSFTGWEYCAPDLLSLSSCCAPEGAVRFGPPDDGAAAALALWHAKCGGDNTNGPFLYNVPDGGTPGTGFVADAMAIKPIRSHALMFARMTAPVK